jgi:hypothetical protein
MLEDRNFFLIESDGRVTLGPEAQRHFAKRAGRYRLVPTSGNMLILQRVADGKAASSTMSVSDPTPGRVTMAGEIDGLGGLVDIINFIVGNAWSGQLAVVDGQWQKSLFFRRGDVCSAASNVPEDRLGAILYRFGVVTEAELKAALNATGGAAKIGQVLVATGKITPHELYTYVRKQIEEIFFGLLTLRTGAFFFERTDEEHGPTSQLALPSKQLLFDGVRRIDELSYFREKLPSVELVLARREPVPAQKLDGNEERVLALVDGTRDITSIARVSHLGEFETTKVLYRLVTSGLVEAIDPNRMQPPAPPSDLGANNDDLYAQIVDAFNTVYGRIHVTLGQHGRAETLHRAVESFFGSAAEFAPLFVGLNVDQDGKLPKDSVIANLHMAPAEDKLDYLHRGLNELLFFQLFTAGEVVDRREEIELHQRLNQIIRDRGKGDSLPIRPG